MSDINGKRRKYSNEPQRFGTMKFDSKKELRRYRELLILHRAKLIRDLDRQIKFPIVVNGLHVCTYVADFVYYEGSQKIVEDCKSKGTRTIAAYRLKAKLMKAVHGLSIRET